MRKKMRASPLRRRRNVVIEEKEVKEEREEKEEKEEKEEEAAVAVEVVEVPEALTNITMREATNPDSMMTSLTGSTQTISQPRPSLQHRQELSLLLSQW